MRVPDVSFVVPVRDEAGNILPLVREIAQAATVAGWDWEAILVDDGSTDGSDREMIEAVSGEPRVRPLRFERPRGKSAALEAGFSASVGRRIVMLDGDGQDDPAEAFAMVALLDGGANLVNGWKQPRLDPWHKTLPSRVFNALAGIVSGLPLHDHNCGLKAFDSEVFRGERLAEGTHRFLPILAASRGWKVTEKPVRHRPRIHGRSKYGVMRFLHGLVDLVRVAGPLPRSAIVGRVAASAGHPGPPLWSRRTPLDARATLRRSVYAILCTVACGMAIGRIASVGSVDRLALEKRLTGELLAREKAAGRPMTAEEAADRLRREKRLLRPFLSSNDRSRWLTIRALVERGTFAIDEIVVEPGWDSIDAVAHPDASGRLRLYSSKPPLLSVIAAVPYWIVHRLTGATLGDRPFEIGRGLMLLYGVVPLAAAIACGAWLVERVGSTDWGRIYAVALLALGTFLLTFSCVFTNHLPAAACAAAAAVAAWRIGIEDRQQEGAGGGGARSPRRRFFAVGLWGGLAAAFDLPALALTGALASVVTVFDPRRALAWCLPALALVAAASFAANLAAHGTVRPAYAHRHGPGSWYDYELTLPNGKVLRSYWRDPQGVDRGEPSRTRYALQALIGHHGVFSLTPAWLLVPAGLAWAMRGRDRRLAAAALIVATVSATVILFYLSRSQPDRNYGGVSSGFRWVFWLAPLWAAALVPAADRLARSGAGRCLGLLLLGGSALSAAYPSWNPWTHPWLWDWMLAAGWITP
jgi:hypothetical protein